MREAGKLMIVLACIGALFYPAGAGADFELKDWSRWRAIKLEDQNAPASYVLVDLDGPVFNDSQTDLGDLRVIDQAGMEIPSKLVVERDESGEEERSVEMLDRSLDSRGTYRFTLDLGADPPRHNRLRLATPTRNFSRRVTIETGDDNRSWVVVRDDGYIFDFSRDTKAQFVLVDYPVSTKRYLRVGILNRREAPVEVSNASVFFSAERQARLAQWPVKAQSVAQDQKLRATVIRLDLGYSRLPVSRIELKTAKRNFHRHVEIEGSNRSEEGAQAGREYWTSIGSGEIFVIQLDRIDRRHLQIDLPETRYRFLRASVFNYDDQPVEFDGIGVYGYPRRLLFQREPGRSYRLFYGNPNASTPRYDLERLSPYLNLAELKVAGLAEDQHRIVETGAEGKPWLDRQPWWLWITMAAAAVILAALIYRLARLTAG